MNLNMSLILKLAITTILAVIGIIYILNKSPVSEVENYQKEDMPKPYVYKAREGFFSNKPSSSSFSADNDDVSLTGSSGRYDDVRIGKEIEE